MHSLAYGYDANANLSQLMYPGGHVVTYAPDALGRATQITGTGGEIYASGISYHPGGAIAGFTYGNGVVHAMTQNARKLPAHSTDTFGAFKVLDDTYVFDANGNVDYMTDAAGTGNQNRTKYLGYDDLDRLIVADAPNQWITATYAYDPLDNLRIADQGTRQYRYNYNATTNLLTDIKTPAGATVFGFTYDARGNTTAKGAQGYTFDVANRMNAVNSVQEYLYDGQGRRVRTGNLADGKRTTWIYSQAGQVMYTDEEPSNKQLFYVYLGNTQVAVRSYDKLTSTATVKYQHTDSLGSPVAETIASPTALNTVRHSYAPYGEAYGEPTGGSVNGTGYTGHVMDKGTGLTYMQQRYYDPQVARFLNVDPIPTDLSTGVNFNSYWYADNNPYRFVDPDGRAVASANQAAGAPQIQDRPPPPPPPPPMPPCSADCMRLRGASDHGAGYGNAVFNLIIAVSSVVAPQTTNANKKESNPTRVPDSYAARQGVVNGTALVVATGGVVVPAPVVESGGVAIAGATRAATSPAAQRVYFAGLCYFGFKCGGFNPPSSFLRTLERKAEAVEGAVKEAQRKWQAMFQ